MRSLENRITWSPIPCSVTRIPVLRVGLIRGNLNGENSISIVLYHSVGIALQIVSVV